MCTGVEIALVAGTAASMYGAKKSADAAGNQGDNSLRQAYYNKEMSEYNAELIREQSREKADRIFESARKLRGRQQVGQAAQGVVIGEGSAGAVTANTNSLASRDALVTLYNGIEGQIAENNEGEMRFRAGENAADAAYDARRAAYIGGISGAISNYHTYKSLTTKR